MSGLAPITLLSAITVLKTKLLSVVAVDGNSKLLSWNSFKICSSSYFYTPSSSRTRRGERWKRTLHKTRNTISSTSWTNLLNPTSSRRTDSKTIGQNLLIPHKFTNHQYYRTTLRVWIALLLLIILRWWKLSQSINRKAQITYKRFWEC